MRTTLALCLFAELLRKIAASCPAVLQTLKNPTAVRDALRACGCSIPLDDWRVALHAIGTSVAHRAHLVVLDDKGKTIALPRTTPWSRTHASLVTIERVALVAR